VALTQTKYESGFSVIECAGCSLPFGVTSTFERQRRDDHRTFYCPNGHNNFYPHETENEKLKRKAEMLGQIRFAWEREQREKARTAIKAGRKGLYAQSATAVLQTLSAT
jgi:hypothetical protein